MAPELAVTTEEAERIRAELDELVAEGRQRVADQLRVARNENGDLAENAVFLDALAEQGRLEQRIAHLESLLDRAEVVDGAAEEEAVVALGRRVHLRDVGSGETLDYVLAGTVDGRRQLDALSLASPVGRAIAGRRPGETVVAETPGGTVELEIVGVRPA